MVTKESFGDLPAWLLQNGDLLVRVLEYGCSVQSICLTVPNGKRLDVCLGYDCAEDYRRQDGSLGAVCGRHANRIGGAAVTLDGVTWKLTKNDGENHLHGGLRGFDRRDWKGEPSGGTAVRFFRLSPHGEEGFPGNLKTWVTYALPDAHTLQIVYEAVADRKTILNLTNHTYFNLNGHASGCALDHILTVNADRITEADAANLPTGRFLDAAGTAFDFRSPASLRSRLLRLHDATLGYDHNFVLNGAGLRQAAVLQGDQSGLCMEVWTDQPGMQLYTGGFLTRRRGKDGAIYSPQCAVCLETQHFPNAPAHPHFPTVILCPGDTFRSETRYVFR